MEDYTELQEIITDSLGIDVSQDELEAFEFVYSNRGVKYEAPTGMTDDCVNALALANRIKQFNPVIVVGNARKLQTTWRDVM